MPKATRGVVAYDIKNFGLAIKDAVAKTVPTENWSKFIEEANRFKIVLFQLRKLQADCDMVSKHGYTQYAAMRQTLMVATNELEVVILSIETTLEQSAAVSDAQAAAHVVNEFTKAMLLLGRIEFQPAPRRARPTLEDIENDRLSSVSNVKPSPAGELGDKQLDALKNMMGE